MSNPGVSVVQATQSATANLFRRITGVVVVLVVLAAIYAGPEQIPFKDFSADYVIQLITVAILVALFIERTIEVILSAWRGQTRARLERELKEKRQAYIADNVEEAQVKAKPDVVEAKEALEGFRAENGRIALLLGFALGIIASALGIRLLAPLLDPQVTDELTRNHLRFLIGLDVIITGALLGGGANGLHTILDLPLKHLNEKRESIGNPPQ